MPEHFVGQAYDIEKINTVVDGLLGRLATTPVPAAPRAAAPGENPLTVVAEVLRDWLEENESTDFDENDVAHLFGMLGTAGYSILPNQVAPTGRAAALLGELVGVAEAAGFTALVADVRATLYPALARMPLNSLAEQLGFNPLNYDPADVVQAAAALHQRAEAQADRLALFERYLWQAGEATLSVDAAIEARNVAAMEFEAGWPFAQEPGGASPLDTLPALLAAFDALHAHYRARVTDELADPPAGALAMADVPLDIVAGHLGLDVHTYQLGDVLRAVQTLQAAAARKEDCHE